MSGWSRRSLNSPRSAPRHHAPGSSEPIDLTLELNDLWPRVISAIGIVPSPHHTVKEIRSGVCARAAWIDDLVVVCEQVRASAGGSASNARSASRSIVRCHFADPTGSLDGDVSSLCLSAQGGFGEGDAVHLVNLPLLTIRGLPCILVSQKNIAKVIKASELKSDHQQLHWGGLDAQHQPQPQPLSQGRDYQQQSGVMEGDDATVSHSLSITPTLRLPLSSDSVPERAPASAVAGAHAARATMSGGAMGRVRASAGGVSGLPVAAVSASMPLSAAGLDEIDLGL